MNKGPQGGEESGSPDSRHWRETPGLVTTHSPRQEVPCSTEARTLLRFSMSTRRCGGGGDPKLIWVLQTTSALRWKGNKWEEHGTDFPDREKPQLGERKEHNLNSKKQKTKKEEGVIFLIF